MQTLNYKTIIHKIANKNVNICYENEINREYKSNYELF